MVEAELSADEARRLQLRAQGFLGARPRGGVTGMLERLGAVQLDTISVLARSHELVPYARLGPVGRGAIETAYWGNGSFGAFEYLKARIGKASWNSVGLPTGPIGQTAWSMSSASFGLSFLAAA